jgi:hypothetical protein
MMRGDEQTGTPDDFSKPNDPLRDACYRENHPAASVYASQKYDECRAAGGTITFCAPVAFNYFLQRVDYLVCKCLVHRLGLPDTCEAMREGPPVP